MNRTGRTGRTDRAHRILLLALLLAAVLRLPALRWDVISDDEAIYDAMGHVVAAGGVMYHDTIDHKPPGLTYTYAACRKLAGSGEGAAARSMHLVHLAGLLAVVGTCVALYAVGRRLLDKEAGAVAALLYGVISATKQPVDGLAVNGELLMNLPLALAALAAVEASRRRHAARGVLDLAAGAFVGCAVLYKYQAGLLGLALPFLILDHEDHEKGITARVLSLITRGLAWAAGLAIPLVVCGLYFRHRGVLDEALFWGLHFNRNYLAQGPGLAWALGRFGMQLVGVILPGFVLYAGAILGLVAMIRALRGGQSVPNGQAFLVAWAAVSIASVGLGGRFFGHYFLQAELPLALVAAPAVTRWIGRAPRKTAAMLGVPALVFFTFAALPSISRRIFSGEDPDFHTIGRAVAAATRPTDSIWVWGNVPQIYHTADRRQGVRFSFCNYLTGLSPATPSEESRTVDPIRDAVPGSLDMALADLRLHRPALVLDTAEQDIKHYGRFTLLRFAPLRSHLATHYRRSKSVSGVVFYERTEAQ